MRWLFWSAAFLIAYTYAGYAVWLWLRARVSPWPILRSPQQPRVSVVVIVRNEEQRLESKMRNLLELDYPPERCQIVAVSDGSTSTSASKRRFAKT